MHFLMLFFLWLILKKKLRKVLKINQWFGRYINAVFCIWEYGEELLKAFVDKFSSLSYLLIKFTAEYSKEQLSFLDVKVKLIDGELKKGLCVKPTDTHQFLTSCHLYHCLKEIPYSQALILK